MSSKASLMPIKAAINEMSTNNKIVVMSDCCAVIVDRPFSLIQLLMFTETCSF